MKSPAFQFYADDFIGGTITMSHEERGLYILALCIQWGQGSLASDDIDRLGAGMAQPSLSKVRAKFTIGEDGRLRQDRMEKEREKQSEYREACAEAGRKGGGNPAFKKGQPNPYYNGKGKGEDNGGISLEHKGEINSPSPSPSPTPISVTNSVSLPPPADIPPAPTQAAKPSWSKQQGWVNVSDEMKSAWKKAYPACVIDLQLQRMALWCQANPTKAHKSNWLKFITNWLKREQDRGGDTQSNKPNGTHRAEPEKKRAFDDWPTFARKWMGKTHPTIHGPWRDVPREIQAEFHNQQS